MKTIRVKKRKKVFLYYFLAVQTFLWYNIWKFTKGLLLYKICNESYELVMSHMNE
jgi:hypothetical protein